MSLQAWFVSGVLTLVMGMLASNRVAVDVAMVGGVALMMLGDVVLGGILEVSQALQTFANPALLLIGSLFIVAAGLTETGAVQGFAQRMLGMPRSVARAQLRLMFPIAVMSGFMNNTPIVAMYLPIVQDWARRLRMSPSKLLLPLSYAAILGGKLTLIGTASNVILMELYRERYQDTGTDYALPVAAKFWGIAALGVPTTCIGVLLVVGLSRWLLPERQGPDQQELARRYQVRVRVEPDSAVAGRSVQDAGLRSLPGLFLTQIERSGEVRIAAPEIELRPGDLLAFAGVLQSVVDLRPCRHR